MTLYTSNTYLSKAGKIHPLQISWAPTMCHALHWVSEWMRRWLRHGLTLSEVTGWLVDGQSCLHSSNLRPFSCCQWRTQVSPLNLKPSSGSSLCPRWNPRSVIGPSMTIVCHLSWHVSHCPPAHQQPRSLPRELPDTSGSLSQAGNPAASAGVEVIYPARIVWLWVQCVGPQTWGCVENGSCPWKRRGGHPGRWEWSGGTWRCEPKRVCLDRGSQLSPAGARGVWLGGAKVRPKQGTGTISLGTALCHENKFGLHVWAVGSQGVTQ